MLKSRHKRESAVNTPSGTAAKGGGLAQYFAKEITGKPFALGSRLFLHALDNCDD
jgi:hypothetical protein